MERDFMGMNGKESTREDGRLGRQDSGSPQWPFSNKMSALQQFMTYKVGQEERAKKLVFDQFSGSQAMTTNDAFEASRKASPVEGQQNSVPVATGNPFFTVHNSPNTPNAMVSAFKQQSMGGGSTSSTPLPGSMVGPFPPRSLSKPSPTTAQLTIFYGGSVCVYDDVPSDKARAIMFLANRGSNTSSNAPSSRAQAPVPSHAKLPGNDGSSMNKTPVQAAIQNMNQTPIQAAVQNMNQTPMQAAVQNMNQSPMQTATHSTNQNPIRMHNQKVIQSQNQNQSQTVLQNQLRTVNHVVSSSSGLSSTVSVTSHSVSQTGSGSSATTDLVGAKSIGTSSTNYQNEPPKTATAVSGSSVPASSMPRAIPQARKASLARFLEKRKERVISAAPYPSDKSSPNDIEGTDGLSKSSEEGWILGSQQKNYIDKHQSPSTKLQM